MVSTESLWQILTGCAVSTTSMTRIPTSVSAMLALNIKMATTMLRTVGISIMMSHLMVSPMAGIRRHVTCTLACCSLIFMRRYATIMSLYITRLCITRLYITSLYITSLFITNLYVTSLYITIKCITNTRIMMLLEIDTFDYQERPRILYQVAIKSMVMWRRGLTTLQLLRVKIQALMKTYIMFIVKSHQLSIMHNAPMMSPDSSSTAMLRTSLTVRSVNHKINGLTSTVKLELPRTFARSKNCAAKTWTSSVSEAVKANLKRKTRKSPQRSIIKQSSSSL